MINKETFKVFAGDNQSAIDDSILELKTEHIVERILDKDFTVWSDKPNEITNRLGWLTSPGASLKMLDEINVFDESDVEKSLNEIINKFN